MDNVYINVTVLIVFYGCIVFSVILRRMADVAGGICEECSDDRRSYSIHYRCRRWSQQFLVGATCLAGVLFAYKPMSMLTVRPIIILSYIFFVLAIIFAKSVRMIAGLIPYIIDAEDDLHK